MIKMDKYTYALINKIYTIPQLSELISTLGYSAGKK